MAQSARRLVGALAALLSIAALASPAAAEYPDRPIHVIVAIAAGSVTDVIARASAADAQTTHRGGDHA